MFVLFPFFRLLDHRESSLNPTTTIVAVGLSNNDVQGK